MKNKGKNKSRMYHNTIALLKDYNKLKEHCKECESSIKEVEMTQEAWEANVEGKEKRYEDYIKSAKRTKERTRIMLDLIDKFMAAYKKAAEKSSDPNALNKYEVISRRYINGSDTLKKIAEDLHCDPKTVSRWHNRAVDELAVYFFGIEGIKLFKID